MNSSGKFVCKTLVVTLMSNALFMNLSYASGAIQNEHFCKIPLTNKKTGATVKVDGVCGMKADMSDSGDKKMHHYRTFTDPAGKIHEQYKYADNNIHDIIEQRIVPEATILAAQPPIVVQPTNLDDIYQRKEKPTSHIVRNGVIIGAAVVAVGGVVWGVRAVRRGAKSEAENKELKAYARGHAAAEAARPANMPSSITLGANVPRGAGQQVAVAGAVPTSSVPRFTDTQGNTYIVQQNPQTSTLETILLYDMLTRPYYFPGAYPYTSFGYSPFIYGPGETVIIENNYIGSDFNYRTTDYSASAATSYTSPETTVTVGDNFVSDTSSVDSWLASDSKSAGPDTSSDWTSTDSTTPARDSGGSTWTPDSTSSSDPGNSWTSDSSSGGGGGSFDSGSSSGSGGDGSSW